MNIQLPALVERVRTVLPDQEIYLVGGAVRDLLLNRELHDYDFVLPSKAIASARKVANALKADFYVLDETRDVGRVLFADSEKKTTLDFIAFQGADINADLNARDFSINAIAIDLRDPSVLVDLLNGSADLVTKRVRAGSPNALSSDPVRVLRAVRMAASLGFSIEPETRQWIKAAAPALTTVSAERLRDELFRLLGVPKLAAALRALDLLGALHPVFPEVVALKGVEQSPPHDYDVSDHSLNVVDKLGVVMSLLDANYSAGSTGDWHSGVIVLRLGRYRQQLSELLAKELVPGRSARALVTLAAIYHDTGKKATAKLQDGRIRFIGHEDVSADLVVERGKALHLSNVELEFLATVVRHHGRPFALTQTGGLPTRRAIYRLFRDTGEAGVLICLLSLADFMGKFASDIPHDELTAHLETLRVLLEAYFEKPHEAVKPPTLLNGDELMSELKLAPGRKVGEILEALREAQAMGDVNTHAEALAFAKSQR